MPIPKNIAPPTLNGLKDDTQAYETHKATITAVNQLQDALRPGTTLTAAALSLSPTWGAGAQITSISGTFKRGKFTVATGKSGITGNPTVTLNFPTGTYTDVPFATIVRNGGNGAENFTYAETVSALTISLSGTPTAADTYSFQFAVRD